MVPPAAETLKSNLNENRTLRRRGKTTSNRSKFRSAYYVYRFPSPWTPADSSTDPERESKLLRLMRSSIRRFDNSRFGCRFVSGVRDPQIQARLRELTASCSKIQIIAYGIGSIESDNERPRLQVALALRLKEELGATAAGPIEVFDPVLSATECAVLVSLGCTVLAYNECCRREAVALMIFFSPHCCAMHYEDLLSANWKPKMLRRMVVLGNSFAAYDRISGANRSMDYKPFWRYLSGIRRYVLEVEMEDWNNSRILKENEDEIEIYRSFIWMSWHFFELDLATDLDCLLDESPGTSNGLLSMCPDHISRASRIFSVIVATLVLFLIYLFL